MPHKLLPCLLLLLLVTLPLYAKANESAYDRVVKTGVIRCGYGISPPVLVQDLNTKEISGLDYDVWQEIGKDLGLKIEFVEEAGWGNFIEGLKTGRYDAFCSELWPDPARNKFLSLTIPVLYSTLSTYVRTDDHRFDRSIEKINSPEVSIPAIEGDVSVSMAQTRFPQANIHYLPQTNTVSDMLMAVTTKKADVIFLDQAMISGFEKENPNVLRKLSGVPAPFVFGSYYSVLSSEIQLRDMINVSLRSMIDDGRLERIAKKYSADYIAPNKNFKQ